MVGSKAGKRKMHRHGHASRHGDKVKDAETPLQRGMREAREPREEGVLNTGSAALHGFLAAIVLTTMAEVQLDSLVEGL